MIYCNHLKKNTKSQSANDLNFLHQIAQCFELAICAQDYDVKDNKYQLRVCLLQIR